MLNRNGLLILWMLLALTGNAQNSTASKKLKIKSDAPLFLREGDHAAYPVIIYNSSEKEITGQLKLELTDAASEASVDGWFQNIFPAQYFTIEKGKSVRINFPIQVPYNFNSVLNCRIVTLANAFRDTVQNSLPILTDKILRTIATPLVISANSVQHLSIQALLETEQDDFIHRGLALELSNHPFWNAYLHMPFWIEKKQVTAEQVFNRWYGLLLAGFMFEKTVVLGSISDLASIEPAKKNAAEKRFHLLMQALPEESVQALAMEYGHFREYLLHNFYNKNYLRKETADATAKLLHYYQITGFSLYKNGQPDTAVTASILRGMKHLLRTGMLPKTITDQLPKNLAKSLYQNEKPGLGANYTNKGSLVSANGPMLMELAISIENSGQKNKAALLEACHSWILTEPFPEKTTNAFKLTFGKIPLKQATVAARKNSGYFSYFIPGKSMEARMGDLTIAPLFTTEPEFPLFGNFQWQYLEEPQRDSSIHPVYTIEKKLFRYSRNRVPIQILQGDELLSGDTVYISLGIRSETDLNQVMVEDQQSAAIKKISIPAYEKTNSFSFLTADAPYSTSFYIPHLPKGYHVIEYPVKMAGAGTYSMGYASIQLMTDESTRAYSLLSNIQLTANKQ